MRYLALLILIMQVLAASGQNTVIRYLSGKGAGDPVEWDFYCSAGRKSGKWTKIAVPSCWEQEGFGGYYYGYGSNDRIYETGRYKYSFSVPDEWREQEIYIAFEGVMTDAKVLINGKLAGPIHQGAFCSFKYNITALLHFNGKNLLEVFVKKHSDNKSVNRAERDADYWVFGGIFRPVYLEVKPKTNIQHIAIDAKADGAFNANIQVQNPQNVKRIEMEIQQLGGEQKTIIFECKKVHQTTRIEGVYTNPSNWSPEFPNMYKAIFRLYGKQGNLIHQVSEKFGFRTVQVKANDGIYVNRVRVKLKGVNRHTFHPKYGRTSSKGLSIEAVNLMKDMNMNAVRMSHYPPDTHFLDVCDSLGMFVIDELPGWQSAYDDLVGEKLLREMVQRDMNHPSVILWSNGNEGGWNVNLDPIFGEIDIQKREVIHPWQDYGLFNTYHYMTYNYLANDGFSKRKIFMPTEFLHGLYDGGHGAGLDDYWFRMWNDPLCGGGFLWNFADEAIERTDQNGVLDSYGNEGPDGILGPFLEKEASFYTIKKIWSPVFFEERFITADFDGTFRIENRYHYTDLKQCNFYVEWIQFSKSGEISNEVIGQTEHVPVKLSPGQKGEVNLTLAKNWRTYDALRIKVTDPYNRTINTWSWPLKSAENYNARFLRGDQPGNRPEVMESKSMWEVSVKDLKLVFDKSSGDIKEVSKNGRIIPLSNGPVFLKQTNNIKEIKSYFFDDRFIISVVFEGEDRFKWIVDSTGYVHLEIAYKPEPLSLFSGISFDFKESEIKGMKWLGNGPYRVYKNRMKGNTFGLWSKDYNNTVTGESEYIYPEFKGYHSNIYWVNIICKKCPDFKVFVHSNDVFLKMLTPQEPKNPENARMIYPKGDISFLHAINSIGTKFFTPSELGPGSNPFWFKSERIDGGELTMLLTFCF
ncbi:MAG: glycoside hydrolase family 2 TIM barrel-domain containing protein [Mangrovibacterium sp.]